MMTKKKPLFAFDLRIEKQIAKLEVYEDDFLEDVIVRFSKLANLGENFHYKIKEKLQNQLRKLLSKQNCSDRIRDKIESFLQESKIIIIGVTQTQSEQPVNHTPYKILKENSFPQRIASSDNIKQHLLQSHKISPHLVKYASKQILVEQQDQSSIQQLLQKYTNRQIHQNVQTSRGYIHNKAESNYCNNRQDQNILQTIRNNRIARSQERQKRSLKEYNYNPIQQQRKNYCNSLYNKPKKETLASFESYQSYKEKYSKKDFAKQPSAQLFKKLQPHKHTSKQSLKRVYQENNYNLTELKRAYNQTQNIAPSKSLKSFKYDNVNEFRTKFDYDRCIQAKGVIGGFKQNKKFKYLGQPR